MMLMIFLMMIDAVSTAGNIKIYLLEIFADDISIILIDLLIDLIRFILFDLI